MSRWVKVLGGLAVFALVGKAFAPSVPPETLAANVAADSVRAIELGTAREERHLIGDTEDRMRARLKDPASAQFSQVLVVRVTGKPVVCGNVNAKNGFGGFTGKKAFVAPAGGTPITEDDLDATNFRILWNQSCTAAGKAGSKP